MKQTLNNLFKNETFVSSLLILLTTAITYGISIPKLGYYYDDWYVLWSGQIRGVQSLIPLFSTDRPFMGVVYSFLYRFIGDTLVGWHLYALLWRLIGAMAFFWILRLLFPKQKYITTLMTILFIVYPGFLSQPDANTKQNHLYGFGTALLSIALMLQAMKTTNRVWKLICIIFSLVLTANYLFIYEYMIGFEATRLLLIGYVLFQDGIRKIRPLAIETIKRFIPYAAVTAGFLYWRIFIFDSSRNATDASRLAGDYLSNLRYMSARLVLETAKDFLDTSIFAWFVKPYQLFSSASYPSLVNAILIAAIVIALALCYTFLFKKWWGAEYDETQTPQLIREFLLIGIPTILFAVMPVILSGRQVDLNDAYKSYGLHPISGVVLFVAAILLMFKPNFRKPALMILIGISVATQSLNADYWARFWDQERQTWWQLTWRAPDIQDETVIMAYMPEGFRLQQDYEVWGPVNLIYNPEPAKIPAITAEVLTYETAFQVLKQEKSSNRARDIRIPRDFKNLLLISAPSAAPACMHVIDGSLPVYAENEPLLTQMIAGYSHIERIIPNGTAPVPPPAIFGSEPAHDWCYYYQKASLANQQGNWNEIGKLYDATVSLNMSPSDKSEIVPFIEGLVNIGRQDEALALYNTQLKDHFMIRLPLCNALEKNPAYQPAPGYDYENINRILCNS
jgi:hypothetical protein